MQRDTEWFAEVQTPWSTRFTLIKQSHLYLHIFLHECSLTGLFSFWSTYKQTGFRGFFQELTLKSMAFSFLFGNGLVLISRFEHQHCICCMSILASLPCNCWALKESRQWIPWGHIIELLSCLKQSLWEPTRAGLCGASLQQAQWLPTSTHGHPQLLCPLHLLTFAGLHLPHQALSIPSSHVKTPHKENNERGLGSYAFPLYPVHRAICYTPASPVTRGTPGHLQQRTPVPPRSSHTFLAPNKMKERKNFSCPWFFSSKPQFIQYWGFLATTLNSSERTLAFVLGCESAFCVSPPHTRAHTELPVHPELSLPCVPLPACFSSSFLSSWVGIAKSELLAGFNPRPLCAGAALPGLISSLLLHDRHVSINTFISKHIYGVESSFFIESLFCLNKELSCFSLMNMFEFQRSGITERAATGDSGWVNISTCSHSYIRHKALLKYINIDLFGWKYMQRMLSSGIR